MSEMTLQEAFNLAADHLQAGRLDIARQILLQILSHVPDHPEALHLLGVIANRCGQPGQGEQLIGRAISIRPDCAQFYSDMLTSLTGQGKLIEAEAVSRRLLAIDPAMAWNNLGIVMVHRGNLAQAAIHFRQASELTPNYFEALTNLANALKMMNRFDESLLAYERAWALWPTHADIILNMAFVLTKLERFDEAIEAYARGIALAPTTAWAYDNLGILLLNKGRFKEALELFSRAVAINPMNGESYNHLAMALESLGRVQDAIGVFQTAIELAPNSALIRANLGNALLRELRIDEARETYEKAIALNPACASSYDSLGTALKETGLLDQALAAFKKSIELDPDNPGAHSNRVYMLHFDPKIDLPSLLKEHQAWNSIHAAKVRSKRRTSWPCMDRSDPLLRVGFVSPDLRLHPVGRFFKPLLENLDPSKIQSFCYSDQDDSDPLAQSIRQFAGQWRSVRGMSHGALADRIAADGIHILVDLAMHMANNRMMLFALKPAPVQVTWLAYCSTTGLETMDYRISDPHMDPPGWWEKHYSEKTVRLPRTYWCYEPPTDGREIFAEQPGPLPAIASGVFTFGCLNNISKINDGVLDAWGRIMNRVGGSRLILHANKGRAWEILRKKFAERGVDPSRIEFVGLIPMKEYLSLHHRIDLALDPFPYNGGTTSCDALWMGVPVLTLAADRPMGRAGVSLLSNLQLESWIAKDAEEYVNMAAGAASRLDELSSLRKTMRERMLKSPLMDAASFARDFEALLNSLWKNFLAGHSPAL